MTTVEFALVGLVVFVVLFGCLEFGRALYVYNTLTEGTRRAARVAAVCPFNHPSVANVAIFNTPGGASTGVSIQGLSTANVQIRYLDESGAVSGTYAATAFVRVAIVGFQLTLNIPLVAPTITLPTFGTTLPSESLGFNPDTGARSC